jgi:predicted MPP superfamily phosphohydrolase
MRDGTSNLGLWLWQFGWLAWPLFALLLWRLWRSRGVAARAALLLPLASVACFIDARFVEPALLTVHETTLQLPIAAPADIALVSDLHVGRFKDQRYLQRVVDRLNAMPLDAVLIAGDFYGEYDGRPLAGLLAPLKGLRHPVYAVPGNHDEGPPDGRPVMAELQAALKALGVHPVQGAHADLGAFTLVGLGDRWAGHDGLAPLHAAPRDKPVVLLMHNPDSAMQLQRGEAALALAGHTHGGQLRIPGLYRRAIPCEHPFDRGLHGFGPVPVFVTTGLGETAVPLRWMNPPVIDVLRLRSAGPD